MSSRDCRLPYWRRKKPNASYDITKLKPSTLGPSERFETHSDTYDESYRSEKVLRSRAPKNEYSTYLQDCRSGLYFCGKPYCPRCARTFRRYFIAEMLRLNHAFDGRVSIIVVLLDTSSKGEILDLDILRCRHSLRKRLERAGLFGVPVIGGFEIVYRARTKKWVLHVNLVVFGGDSNAIRRFEAGFPNKRAVRRDGLNDPTKQLSYVLKFTTYHRPYERHGAKKPRAVPLNPSEHFELVRWMAQYDFSDYLFLFYARRRGTSIELSSKLARNA